MVEQPDTAAIRAEVAARNHVCVNGTTAHELCDALDAARAELAATDCCDSSNYAGHIHIGPGGCGYQHCHCPGGTPGPWRALEKRAEAAEAERDDFKQDSLAHLTMWQNKHAALQSAEARIAELYFLRVQVSDAHHHAVLRAEAAEAELARVAEDYAGLIVRCKATEARIAAALAILHDCHVTAEDMNRVRRALAGDVG